MRPSTTTCYKSSPSERLADALNSDKGTIGILLNNRELYDNLRATLGRADNIMQKLQAGQGTAGKFLKDPAVYDETRQTIAGMHKLVDDLNAGKGTAGQLLKSDDLSNQLKATIGKLDSILDKLNSGKSRPDEKGIETLRGFLPRRNHLSVRTPAPMRRGLRRKFISGAGIASGSRRRFGLRGAPVQAVNDRVIRIPASPTGLCFLPSRGLAVRFGAGVLAVSHSRVRPKPPAAYRTRSLPGLWHGELLSSPSGPARGFRGLSSERVGQFW